VIVFPLNGSAESVDVWPADWIVGPALGLKSWANANGTLTEVAVAVDSAILTPPCDFNASITQMPQKFLTEMLEGLSA
jgi:hypothetical protein